MIEQKLLIKPLSVNDAWKGRRFKTDKYKWYETQLLYMLGRSDDLRSLSKDDRLSIQLKFGFSNSLSDWDNPIKPIVDILQTKYGFNDKQIFKGCVEKEVVPKGEEYIYFKVEVHQ